jgi:hypothetical protein
MHVRAQLTALRRERLNPKTESHAEAMDGQIGLSRPSLRAWRPKASRTNPTRTTRPWERWHGSANQVRGRSGELLSPVALGERTRPVTTVI